MESNIDNLLTDRGNNYGDWRDHACITVNIKDGMRCTGQFAALPDHTKEALDMIAHKIGRIINGDPFYKDSWTDIMGYARLEEMRL